jgi:hypothetical protein
VSSEMTSSLVRDRGLYRGRTAESEYMITHDVVTMAWLMGPLSCSLWGFQSLPQPDVFRHHSLSGPLLHSYNEWRRHTTSKLESEPDAYRSVVTTGSLASLSSSPTPTPLITLSIMTITTVMMTMTLPLNDADDGGPMQHGADDGAAEQGEGPSHGRGQIKKMLIIVLIMILIMIMMMTMMMTSPCSTAPMTVLLNKEKDLRMDVDKQRVLLEDGTAISYDKCLIATAGTSTSTRTNTKLHSKH